MNRLISAFFSLITLIVGTSFVCGETYRIDSSSATKTIFSPGYVMGSATNPAGVPITLNNYYLMKAGEPWLPVMGEIHCARHPENMWEYAIKKMNAGGLDIVATYDFWIHHEETNP